MARILLFSYLSYDKNDYKGGGWINSLANVLANNKNDVAIAYLSSNKQRTTKYSAGGITYYPINYKPSLFRFLYFHYLKKTIRLEKTIEVNRIIDDFSPDIIQLFGIETFFGSILYNINHVPIVVHIQGICSTIPSRWYPCGISKSLSWWRSPLRDKILATTTSDDYCRMMARAEAEKHFYQFYHYFLGRTEWDYRVSRLLSPDSLYFHSDEVLRSEFYNKKWSYFNRGKVVISTTLNGDIYKGYDVILQTACLLKEHGVEFEWNIYGVSTTFSLKSLFEKFYKLRFLDNNVYFRGKKDAEELVDCMLQTTFYVHPSHIDNSPNALCEAMLLGVPCIASYVGGVPSLIRDGYNGILIPDSDSYSLASIIMFYSKDRSFLEKLSVNARSTALSRHSSDRIYDDLSNTYNQVIKDFKAKQFK